MGRKVRAVQQGSVRDPSRRPAAGAGRAHGHPNLNAGSPRRFEEAAAAVGGLDARAAQAAVDHHRRLTKPAGSLGRLEAAGVALAAIAGESPPPVPEPATVAVFAGDHGVLAEGVSPWPQEVTAQMIANFCAGGAAINVLARHSGTRVIVVDVGVAIPLDPAPGLVVRKVRQGTANLVAEPAMTVDDARQALDVGAEVAATAVGNGARCLLTGDMGIGNTTPSAAIIAAFTGRPPAEVTGRGTGIDDATWARKVSAIELALERTAIMLAGEDAGRSAMPVLASVGGLEIAALAGYVVGGAAARVPVLLDGVVALAGAVVAAALAPAAIQFCFAGHRSTEPGATIALEHLGLVPLLDLGMRLGEGTGATLALPLLQSAAKLLQEMATFDSAGVTDKSSA